MARDLSQLQKNGDATHYKVASSWTIQDLSQYFGTDWNLALKTDDNSVILANDTDGYLYQNLINDNQTDYSFFFFPLKNEIKLLKIKINVRCESYNQGTGYFGSDKCSMGVLLNNSQQSGSPNQRVIVWTKTTASTVDDIKLEVDDTDWHTYERTLSTPIVGDYFGFFMLKGIWRVKNIELTIPETSNGGGATHIAKVTGQLKDLSSNLSDILMVSGGGGGGLLVDDTDYLGKEAGGISGSGDNSADQSTGNAFGQGESGTNVSGGGSGLYGGYKGTSAKSGGAGSGYIGNSLLSNKKMVGYNVPTSSAEGTKTESVNVFDSSPVTNKPKAGNGHARIKFLREPDYYWIAQYTVDGTTYNLMQIGDVTIPDSIINATQMTCTAITGRGSTVPSFVTNLGDLIFDLQSSIDADITLEFINNSFLRFLFGRYNYITSGTRMNGSQYYDVANSRVFYQSGWANWGDGKVKYYIAVKIDKVNHRAYMIVLEHTYYHWGGNIGYTAYAIGGMPNSVDLLYETFKDVR